MSGFAEYSEYDAVGLARLIATRVVSVDEVLDAAIARIDRLNPHLNAVIHRLDDEARAAVAAGLPDGPLRGVPYLLKDVGVLCRGAPTGFGSALFDGYIADHDSTLVARLRRAGLVILGKTNTPEFALTVATEPRRYGPTRNPWNRLYGCGGSSGGSAAAVAARLVPAAHAGDGGGSIRVPASHCGLFGLKPSRARIPSGPDLGEGWAGVSTEHALTRSVRDSAALLDATHGAEVGDPYYAPPAPASYLATLDAPPPRLRIALTTRAPNGGPVDADCRHAAERTAALCVELGHTVEEASFEFDMAAMVHAYRVIVAANLRDLVEARVRALGRALRADDLEPITQARIAEGTRFNAIDYARATADLHRIGRQMGRFFERYDILLSPTAAAPAARLGAIRMDGTDLDAFDATLFEHAPFTAHFNAAGHPAASVPVSMTAEGLPVGAHLGGRFGEEAVILALARQIETARPWSKRVPPGTSKPPSDPPR